MLAVWVRTVAILVLLTLVAADRAVWWWLLALVAAWAVGGLLVERALGSLRVTQALATADTMVDQRLTVHLRLTNRGWLPIPWVRLGEALPPHLRRRPPAWLLALPPGRTAAVRFDVVPRRRGVYRLGRVELEAGDWFGLWSRAGDIEVPLWLTVFPRPAPPAVLPPPPRQPQGERVRPVSPFRALESAGLRPYQSSDPLRWVDWKATARVGSPMVRSFPPVRDRASLIVLDLRPGGWPEAERDAWVEAAIALAAGWAVRAWNAAESVGLFACGRAAGLEPAPVAGRTPNASRRAGDDAPPTGEVRVALAARRDPVHRRHLLRTLAWLEPADAPGFSQDAVATLGRLAPRASVAWITGVADAEVMAATAAAARRGHAIAVIAARGCATARVAPGVTVWPLDRAGMAP